MVSLQEITWTKLYQKPGKCKGAKLVLRPQFPPVYRESEMPNISNISEVVVIRNDVWKVGDLVDWWSDSCYWSGRLTEVLEHGKFRIELFPPPAGEGLSYEASSADFRPSLDWSPEHGWTVPISGNEDRHSCARLVKPLSQGGFLDLTAYAVIEGGNKNNTEFSSQTAASYLVPPDRSEKVAERTAFLETQIVEDKKGSDAPDIGAGKTSCSDSTSVRDASAEIGRVTVEKDCHNGNGPSKKLRTDRSIPLNSMCSNTIEAAILDLEELVNRVKWIKHILEFGMPLPNSVQPSWKFLEHRSSTLPK
ncbi:hypothetical protein MANES_03G168100v8 [Manihot esculenta]|uniref:Agenet domain-containing protein n=6 Tax=Manihot esculenta TaxID=3983 RepID=A0A251LS67_MANES|nr:hypothetical protein MANES_03G168100v8 [Manihot esculenta]KAG8658625.1 hypothetical protein MANES_03G168100v8 [Manihot esculenta]KAG8658626.1 hypothetical protein MANES_03G168100v8 [Manihot esculenta]KAG8658627.1 hypothetical protein MANES_03G168100v8 [Manihot esculenta]KAG8658628.1 hypothetical protein MANES_03G168100v8 [Manihot esculenta]